jgi:hypothetical protein
VDGLEGKKTAIRDKAGDTKGEATEMMQTYLGGENEALDGFEFLSMAEAASLPLRDRREDGSYDRRPRRQGPRCLGGRHPARAHRHGPAHVATEEIQETSRA